MDAVQFARWWPMRCYFLQRLTAQDEAQEISQSDQRSVAWAKISCGFCQVKGTHLSLSHLVREFIQLRVPFTLWVEKVKVFRWVVFFFGFFWTSMKKPELQLLCCFHFEKSEPEASRQLWRRNNSQKEAKAPSHPLPLMITEKKLSLTILSLNTSDDFVPFLAATNVWERTQWGKVHCERTAKNTEKLYKLLCTSMKECVHHTHTHISTASRAILHQSVKASQWQLDIWIRLGWSASSKCGWFDTGQAKQHQGSLPFSGRKATPCLLFLF